MAKAKKKSTKKRKPRKKSKQTFEENPLAVDDQVQGFPEDEVADLDTEFDVGNDEDDEIGEGVEKGDDLSSEIDRNLRVAVNHDRDLREQQREDIKFYLGEQWTDEEKAILEEENRPCLTFNKIKPMIRLIVGHVIQNSARIQISPEGGEDELFSQIMDKALDHIDKVSNLNFKLTYLFMGSASAGRAWIEFHQDFNEDPIFGRLKIPYLGAFKVFIDPSGTEYDVNEDCDFLFKVVPMSKSKLKQLYPEKEAVIDEIEDDSMLNIVEDSLMGIEGDANNYGNDPRKPQTGINDVEYPDELIGDLKQITVVEYWKKVYKDKWFIYFTSDGSIQEYDTEDEANEALTQRKQFALQERISEIKGALPQGTQISEDQIPSIDEIQVDHVLRKSRVARMHVAVKAGDSILTNGLQLSPFEPEYHGFPQFHSIAEWAPESDDPEYRIQGFVRSLKDPQREINKSRSQYLHILNTSANSGWIGDDDALSDEKWIELQQFGATPGITVRKKRGTTLERISPVEPSLAQNVREKASTDDMKEVSGINADLLSVDTKASPSGKAIALRIRQAVTILAPSFMNFRYTKRLIGTFLFKILPTMMDAVKLEKILGKTFMQQNNLTRQRLGAYLKIVEDGRYDVSISEQGTIDTLREETFESLLEMQRTGQQLPPDVLLEFMNIPNKQELLNKINEFQQKQAALQQEQKGSSSSK